MIFILMIVVALLYSFCKYKTGTAGIGWYTPIERVLNETLNHDELKPRNVVHNYEPHNIVYGKTGWTDTLDDATIALLMSIYVIRLHSVVRGVGFETRIYVSVNGREPV